MREKIGKLLENKGGNYLLPFFWQHGEPEDVLRKYMQAIQACNIGAVCVESRPHPDFCGEKWWQDMDVILDEARKRGMKVWILDDSHFPTGYANGAMEGQPDRLRRQSICCRMRRVKAGEKLHLGREQIDHPDPFQASAVDIHALGEAPARFDDDKLWSLYAVRQDGQGFAKAANRLDLRPLIRDGQLDWEAPEGEWKVYALHLSRNFGPHRSYINMMDRESCRVLIDAVYEPHYAHYKEDFGKTIAGFFSDEPELGNGHMYEMGDSLGKALDYPWSRELEQRLRERFGDGLEGLMALLWENEANSLLTAKLRYAYMDAVSNLVKEDFSCQLGEWCRERGVEYIGHLIEDNNHHSRMGSSLGHYFRGLAGQDMAGIDDIGGQVFPQGEEVSYDRGVFQRRDGTFFHYMLGKLASSAAAIEPLKQGRSMCEIFGNYGWQEGVRLEKYLADHFLVRGVNRYVPHAFTPKEFPDSDCPPHFYAHGHNPQYRHFGCLMAYMNRVCELISGGRHAAPVALVYHGEGEWTGDHITDDAVGHVLYDCQIDYDIIPQDVFACREEYDVRLESGLLRVNTQEYRAVLIPRMQFVTKALAEAVAQLAGQGVPVFFVGGAPEGICDTDMENPADGALLEAALEGGQTLALEDVPDALRQRGIPEVEIAPGDCRIRILRYLHQDGGQILYLVNEGTEMYRGQVRLTQMPLPGTVYRYDAWDNQVRPAVLCRGGISVEIEPLKSMIIVLEDREQTLDPVPSVFDKTALEELPFAGPWRRSLCRSIDYPAFGPDREVSLPDRLEQEEPLFSGFARYENVFEAKAEDRLMAEISDAFEGVEAFLNGRSLGIQIVPTYRFDLSGCLQDGQNELRIEVATTLERQMSAIPSRFGQGKEASCKSGISGTVRLYRYD